MSSALTPKQEKFCQAIITGHNQSEACRLAYGVKKATPKTINERASRLMANSKVVARVEELRGPVVEQAQYTLGAALAEADEARLIAKVDRDGSVMVQATALKAKLSGLLVEKAPVPLSVLETTATDVLLALLSEYERRIAARQLEHADHA